MHDAPRGERPPPSLPQGAHTHTHTHAPPSLRPYTSNPGRTDGVVPSRLFTSFADMKGRSTSIIPLGRCGCVVDEVSCS